MADNRPVGIVGAGLIGGEGGIEHYLRHLGPSQVARWKSLGEPELSDEIAARIVEGVKRETAGRTIAELAADRDAGCCGCWRS